MNEEIQFGMGLDTSNFARGMREVKAIAKETASSVKESFVDGLKDLFAPLAGAVAAGKIFESIKSVAEWGKQIKLAGEEAGVSAEFIQGLEAASKKLGISSETANTALSFLSRKIGEARTGSEEAQKAFEKWNIEIDNLSNEQIFYLIAQKMKEIQDPAVRSALAFETMGKSGKELGAGLTIGADAVKELVENSSKLSDAEIEKLDEVDARLEEIARRWHILWGSIVAGAVSMPGGAFSEKEIQERMNKLAAENAAQNPNNEYAGDYDTESFRETAIAQLKKEAEQKAQTMALTAKENELLEKAARIRAQADSIGQSTAQKLNALNEKKLELEDEINDREFAGESTGKQKVELANTENQIIEERIRLKKEADDQDKSAHAEVRRRIIETYNLQASIDAALMQNKLALQAVQQKKDAGTKLSLDELAKSPVRMTGELGEDQQKARQMAELDRQREWNRQHGFYDLAQERVNQIEEIRKTLSDNTQINDRKPLESAEESATRAADHLQTLVKMASEKGIPVGIKIAD